jgi:hypothetical protein
MIHYFKWARVKLVGNLQWFLDVVALKRNPIHTENINKNEE